ncbi:sodium:solute symporter family protein [Acetobacterium bakii]|uniref:sodium:solute symporter family protein n=1 Tax=Acetobacterium bakii TaxID=52689 RepID=UPI000682DD10|nr:sodium:solute symporter family protein [Acetobacterium bakii]
MNIPLIIVILYMILIVGIAYYSTKITKTSSSKDYLLAGQRLPWYLIAVMVTGNAVGGSSTIGVAQNAYTSGISAGWYTGAWAAGAAVFGLFISAKVRKMNINTVSEIFLKAFGTVNGTIAIVVQVIILFGINALQIIAGGALLSVLLPDFFTYTGGMIASTIVYILVSFIGGLLGASMANLMNVVVIYLGLIVAVIASITKSGGIGTVISTLPPGGQWLDLVSGMGPGILLGWVITMIINTPANQTMYQPTMGAIDEKHAKKGMLTAAVLIFPIGFIAAALGILAAIQFPGLENSAMALPALTMTLNPVIAGLVFAGLWAADVSTAIALLLGISSIVTKNIIVDLIYKDLPDKKQIIISKVVLVLSALMGLLVATNISGIISFLMQLLTLYTPYTLLIFAILYAPGYLRKSTCFLTVLSALVVMVIWMAVPESHIVSQVVYLCLPVSAFVMFMTVIFDKRKVDLSTLYTAEN